MNAAQTAAYKWLKERGGDAVFARTKAGGYIWLAQGEIGPFTYATVKRLVGLGKAEYVRDDKGRIQRLVLK